MRRQLSYADAVRLLEPVDSKVIEALGNIASGALLATAALGLPQALTLLEAREQVTELGQKLVHSLGKKLSGRARYSRTEKLMAAHSVIVVTAFFDALAKVQFPFDLPWGRGDQLTITTGSPQSSSASAWVKSLTQVGIPVPTPQVPFENTIESVTSYYRLLFKQLISFLQGLAVWDNANSTKRTEFIRSEYSVIEIAVQKYEELYRRLAADCPEFFFWANLQDHRATRAMISALESDIRDRFLAIQDELGNLQTGFGAVTSLAEQMSSISKPSQIRIDLRAVYQRQLNEPAADFDTSGGPLVPPLSTSYINPRCRIRTVAVKTQPGYERAVCLPGDENWWNAAGQHDDLQGFLMGFLTGPEATDGPLVVLGQPGSGKSVFTRVLAASLSSGDFLPIRVELRRVAANAPVQNQIEAAIRELTGASMDWPDLVAASEGALPVILLDGFDELLQATRVSKSEYLEQVREFQKREGYLGRPAVVIVTSRLAVADRARFPDGTVVIRLEEFDEQQIERWIVNWNAANANFFSRSGLAPLSIQAIIAHADLSAQPLLLLMLALYDSENNALQRVGVPLSRSELYEELLTNFARREVIKQHPNLLAGQISQSVDRELDQLAVFACAMFNRSAQSATEQQLTADLESLLPEIQPGTAQRTEGTLTPAQLAVGRFYFFVYESQASFGHDEARTYEFMHATFAEYLVARIVTRVLEDLSRPQSPATAFIGERSRPEADLLYALLSFVPLTTRSPVVSFLEDLTRKFGDDDRARAKESLIPGLELSPQLKPERAFASYSPAALPSAAREAAYIANLVTIITVISDQQEATTAELFPAAADPIQAWRSSAYLWKSQLPPSQWQALVAAFSVRRIRDSVGRRELSLRMSSDTEPPPLRVRDLSWWSDGKLAPLRPSFPRVPDALVAQMLSEAMFLCDQTLDYLVHAIDPLIAEAGPQIGRAVNINGVGVVSMANVLAWLRLSSHQGWEPSNLIQLYQAYLDGLTTANEQETTHSTEVVAAQLCEDVVALPPQLQVEFADAALHFPASMDESDTSIPSDLLPISKQLAYAKSINWTTSITPNFVNRSVYGAVREAMIGRLTQRVVNSLDEIIVRLRRKGEGAAASQNRK